MLKRCFNFKMWSGILEEEKKVVQSLVERVHLLARCIQGPSHPVAAVHTKGSGGERKPIHTA